MNQSIPLRSIPALLTGCMETAVTCDALQVSRLPDAMRSLQARDKHPDGVRIRAECSSGIRLRCRTSATELELQLRFGDVPWPHCRSYRCVLTGPDGGVLRIIGPEAPTAPMDWQATLDVQGTEGVVDLWFPHCARTDILGIRVDADATIEPAPPPTGGRWLVYGDSITQGMQASLPTHTYVGRVARARDLEVLNLGVGGAILTPELAVTVPDWPWDITSIAYGTNDLNRGIPPDTVAERASALIERLLRIRPAAPIVLITIPPWLNAPAGQAHIQRYRDALTACGSRYPNVVVVDGATLIPADPANFWDGVHPNDSGFAAYAARLEAVMAPLLRSGMLRDGP